jgi:hypothetical protein
VADPTPSVKDTHQSQHLQAAKPPVRDQGKHKSSHTGILRTALIKNFFFAQHFDTNVVTMFEKNGFFFLSWAD